MKYIKIIFSNGTPITLPFEQADALFQSSNQLVRITDTNGNWTGRVINKAFIVSANRDREEEHIHRLSLPQLPEPKTVLTPEQAAKIVRLRDSIAKNLSL